MSTQTEFDKLKDLLKDYIKYVVVVDPQNPEEKRAYSVGISCVLPTKGALCLLDQLAGNKFRSHKRPSQAFLCRDSRNGQRCPRGQDCSGIHVTAAGFDKRRDWTQHVHHVRTINPPAPQSWSWYRSSNANGIQPPPPTPPYGPQNPPYHTYDYPTANSASAQPNHHHTNNSSVTYHTTVNLSYYHNGASSSAVGSPISVTHQPYGSLTTTSTSASQGQATYPHGTHLGLTLSPITLPPTAFASNSRLTSPISSGSAVITTAPPPLPGTSLSIQSFASSSLPSSSYPPRMDNTTHNVHSQFCPSMVADDYHQSPMPPVQLDHPYNSQFQDQSPSSSLPFSATIPTSSATSSSISPHYPPPSLHPTVSVGEKAGHDCGDARLHSLLLRQHDDATALLASQEAFLPPQHLLHQSTVAFVTSPVVAQRGSPPITRGTASPTVETTTAATSMDVQTPSFTTFSSSPTTSTSASGNKIGRATARPYEPHKQIGGQKGHNLSSFTATRRKLNQTMAAGSRTAAFSVSSSASHVRKNPTPPPYTAPTSPVHPDQELSSAESNESNPSRMERSNSFCVDSPSKGWKHRTSSAPPRSPKPCPRYSL